MRMNGGTDALIGQLLEWVGEGRLYAETLDAWRTSCPRFSIWEDALSEGLVRVEPARDGRPARVFLTPDGEAALGRIAAASRGGGSPRSHRPKTDRRGASSR